MHRVMATPIGFNLADVSAATRAFVELNHPELFAAMDYGEHRKRMDAGLVHAVGSNAHTLVSEGSKLLQNGQSFDKGYLACVQINARHPRACLKGKVSFE